jgi:hypothetical protein
LSKTESDLIERHFRSAGYRDASEDHGHPRRVWSGVARPVPAVADLAGTTTLTAELSAALDGVRGPRRGMIRGGCWSIWRWRSPTAPYS